NIENSEKNLIDLILQKINECDGIEDVIQLCNNISNLQKPFIPMNIESLVTAPIIGSYLNLLMKDQEKNNFSIIAISMDPAQKISAMLETINYKTVSKLNLDSDLSNIPNISIEQTNHFNTELTITLQNIFDYLKTQEIQPNKQESPTTNINSTSYSCHT